LTAWKVWFNSQVSEDAPHRVIDIGALQVKPEQRRLFVQWDAGEKA
jgi:hypothetical protein